jgi:hypothetical protein
MSHRLAAGLAAALLILTVLPPRARASAPEPVRVLTLPNGALAVIAPGDGPNRLSFELAVGPSDDPRDRPGVAQLAARSLLLGTQGLPLTGELTERLGTLAGSWSSGLVNGRTRVDFEGVTDWSAALDLGVQVFAEPRFPAGEVLRLRLDLAAEAAHGLEGRAQDEAAALLAPSFQRRADAFDILTIEQAHVRALHALAYRPERLSVVLQGDLPPAESLDGLLLRTLGGWAGSGEGGPSPGSPPAASADHRPLHAVHGGPQGLVAAFPAGTRPAASALALASLAERLGESWSLAKGRAALGTRPGSALVLLHQGGDPPAALSRLERELARWERRGPRSRDSRAARQDLSRRGAGLEAGLLLATAPRAVPSADLQVRVSDWPPAELLASVSDDQLNTAAAELAAGARAVILGFGDESAARSFAGRREGVTVRGATEPVDAIARELEREGGRWTERAGEAHGGATFAALTRMTLLGERVLRMGETDRPAGLVRLDVDLPRLQARQETRPRSQRAENHVIVFDGERAVRAVPQGDLDQGGLGSMTFRTALFRTPLVALHRAVTTDQPIRSRGRVLVEGRPAQELEVADARCGLVRLAVDETTHRLVRVAFRNRLPFKSQPVDIELLVSGHEEQDGVLVYRTEGLHMGDAERSMIWRDLVWSFREDVPSPVEVRTDANDLGQLLR